MTLLQIAGARQKQPYAEPIQFSAGKPSKEVRKLQRMAQEGKLKKLPGVKAGIYVDAGLGPEEVETCVRSHWQTIAGILVPGGVVSHISAMTKGLLADNTVFLSHPTVFGKKLKLPGLTLILLQGPGPLPDDFSLGGEGIYWASSARFILENIGRRAPRRVPAEEVETYLIKLLNASGEHALHTLKDKAAAIQTILHMEGSYQELGSLISTLLGTHAKGKLRTADGKLLMQGKPVDSARKALFQTLADRLRVETLPSIKNRLAPGIARHNHAFIESYFSNYVEGTKFNIEEAQEIVLRNKPVTTRPKDSHDILGVYRLATTTPYRDSPPPVGADFVLGLQAWHGEMLRMRPEVNPGSIKQANNFAGTTQFVSPEHVRGTLELASEIALSVPEGLARAIFYAFLVSEVHPFEDGNGRLSRLVMNAELSRVGLSRVIIPTLFHPQYMDCARVLTRQSEPEGFIRSIVKMAVWSAQFNYDKLDDLILTLKATHALEESPAQFRLLNLDGSMA